MTIAKTWVFQMCTTIGQICRLKQAETASHSGILQKFGSVKSSVCKPLLHVILYILWHFQVRWVNHVDTPSSFPEDPDLSIQVFNRQWILLFTTKFESSHDTFSVWSARIHSTLWFICGYSYSLTGYDFSFHNLEMEWMY